MNSSSDRLEAYQKLMSDLAQYGRSVRNIPGETLKFRRSFGDISSHHSRIARALEQSEGTIIEEHNVTREMGSL